MPLAEGLDSVEDLPHTIVFAIMYRARIDSFGNLPKDKQPPRDLWDKPWRLSKFLDTVWDKEGPSKDRNVTEMYEFDMEDVE